MLESHLSEITELFTLHQRQDCTHNGNRRSAWLTLSSFLLMRCLLFFLDGIGLGSADPQVNPFARQEMPALTALLGGRRLVAESFDALAPTQ